jgi:hypothetical protein
VSAWLRRRRGAEVDAGAGGGPLAGAQPLFVLGPPRSGTTLVARLLDAHPQVLVTNETRIFTFLHQAFAQIPTGDRGGLHCARVHGAEIVDTLRAHGRALVRESYERIAAVEQRRGLRYWGDKNPHFAACLDLVEDWFPEARFVVVRRDPRDIVCSILEMWARMELVPPRDAALGRWDLPEQKLVDVCRSVARTVAAEDEYLGRKPADRSFRIVYERLLDEPEAWLERLFVDFLGLAEAEAPLRKFRELAAVDVHGAVAGAVDFKARSVGRYAKDLDPAQVAILDAELGALAAQCAEA